MLGLGVGLSEQAYYYYDERDKDDGVNTAFLSFKQDYYSVVDGFS